MSALPGIERHPHARALLVGALPPGSPSHAYLFHGPAGAGKRVSARAFAAALLADGAEDPDGVRERVARGTHPDLTWVTPSGAAEMLVSDIEEPVLGVVSRTPFEARRRVFVLEQADAMGEATANRLLKALEEPPDFAHFVLLTARLGEVLPTVASRCLHVRFEAPELDALLALLREHGVAEDYAQACARLALGDADRALMLAGPEGRELRVAAERFALAALRGELADAPWSELIALARRAGAGGAEQLAEGHARALELSARADRGRLAREHEERVRRVERRTRAATLDLALSLVGLCYRDGACIACGAPELVHASDSHEQLGELAGAGSALLRALDLVEETRAAVALNVGDELALEALAYRIAAIAAISNAL